MTPREREAEREAVRVAITYRLGGLTLDELRLVLAFAKALEEQRHAVETVDQRTPGAGL